MMKVKNPIKSLLDMDRVLKTEEFVRIHEVAASP